MLIHIFLMLIIACNLPSAYASAIQDDLSEILTKNLVLGLDGRIRAESPKPVAPYPSPKKPKFVRQNAMGPREIERLLQDLPGNRKRKSNDNNAEDTFDSSAQVDKKRPTNYEGILNASDTDDSDTRSME